MKSMKNISAKREQGFTLIEIAIVLVIIGLLLGGVLQGQQLIENSRVKSATNDFNGIAAATFSYQDRYGRLPGDDPAALPARGGSWPATSAGNGNGLIAAPADAFAPTATEEVSFFFKNLRSAGFISGDPTQSGVNALPANPFGGLITITSAAILTDGTTALAGTKICMGNVGGSSAIALDTQLDDGVSNSGRFRGVTDGGVPNLTPPAAGAAATAYTEDLTYTVCLRM